MQCPRASEVLTPSSPLVPQRLITATIVSYRRYRRVAIKYVGILLLVLMLVKTGTRQVRRQAL
jgi:hypothetical protein